MAGQSPSLPHTFDGYTAIERLASGPMTALYSATQQLLGRKVVIKTLSSGVLAESAFGQNIEREAAILSALNHPNIASLHDLRRSDGTPWLVREWVPGWTLSELLQRLGRFTPRLALGIAGQLAHALAHAHSNGIIHRGLHPDCIVIGSSGEAKIISFSRASGDRIARVPELLDVEPSADFAPYVAPEQLLGEAPDSRVDVYSFGALLLHMLGGRPPEGKPRDRVGLLLDTTATATDLDPKLRDLLSHCLAQQSSERLVDGRALVAAIDELRQPDGALNAQASTALELQRLGLAVGGGGQSSSVAARSKSISPAAARHTSRQPVHLLIGIIVALAAVVALVVLRPWSTGSTPRIAKAGSGRAEVRVVVEPWARVYVDDQFFDVTPFADPVVLTPGTHQFRFEHPKAPVEKRQVSVVADEAILLDVSMSITTRSGVPGAATRPHAAPSAQEPGP